MFHRRGKTLTSVSAENRQKNEEYRLRGDRLFASGNFDMAIACYSKALGFNEYDYRSWWGRAKCKMENVYYWHDESYKSDAERSFELAPEAEQAEMRRVYAGYLSEIKARDCAD